MPEKKYFNFALCIILFTIFVVLNSHYDENVTQPGIGEARTF
jgi:hypothetical protein